MAGIKETEDVLDFALSLGSAIGNAAQDGFQFGDLALIFPVFVKLPAAASGISQVPAELADLDENEKAELKAFVESHFDIPGDKAELIVERSLQFGLETVEFGLFLRDQLKK